MRATGRPWKRASRRCERSRARSTDRACRACCRREPRATRSTARCGTSRPSRQESARGRWPGLAAPRPVLTCYTLSLAAPEAMAAAALAVPQLKLLKLKLGGVGDPERMAAVRAARPDARLVADANEAWTAEMLSAIPRCGRAFRARADRAAAARRRRRDARARPSPCSDLRGRKRTHQRRSRPRSPPATMPSTSSSTRPAASPRRLPWRAVPASGAQDHGRFDGGDLARRCPGAAARQRRRLGRSRRPAAARARPRAWTYDRQRA